MSVVTLKDVTKSFGDSTVLKPVNLTVEEGRIVGLVGRNGSGKTILLKIICGLMLPTSGSVYVHGERIGGDRDFPRDTGILIETPEFIPYQTAYQNLHALSLITRKTGKEEIRDIIRQAGLDPESRKPVGKFSLGMRQRLGIAQAIMEQPKLLLLDEPMNGLDKTGVKDMRTLFSRLRDAGKTILLASHMAEDIDLLCDSVYEIDDGIVSLRSQPQS